MISSIHPSIHSCIHQCSPYPPIHLSMMLYLLFLSLSPTYLSMYIKEDTCNNILLHQLLLFGVVVILKIEDFLLCVL